MNQVAAAAILLLIARRLGHKYTVPGAVKLAARAEECNHGSAPAAPPFRTARLRHRDVPDQHGDSYAYLFFDIPHVRGFVSRDAS